MRSRGLWLVLPLAITGLAVPVVASAPPPPPEYVSRARDILTDAANKDPGRIEAFFADDVTASINGRPVSANRAEWLAWWRYDRAHYYGRTIGYSMGWEDDGTLLILDQFDTQDNEASPPPPGDPRPSTRAMLYRFGPDHLIHFIGISKAASFFTPVARRPQ